MVNKKTFICIVVGIILLMLAMFVIGYHSGKKHTEKKYSIDTTMVVTSDYKAPKPVKEVGVGEVDIPLLIYTDSDNGGKTVMYVSNITGSDSSPKDTAHVSIPITQKTYSDSDYVAYVSGFMPRLDSIQVKSKVITITKKDAVTKYHRLNIGLTGGLGYGITTKKPDVFVGVGVTVNIFKR